jgi:hypothetical protein
LAMAFGVRLIGGALISGVVVVDIPYLLESAGLDYSKGLTSPLWKDSPCRQ